jgi:cystathionine beta-lyase
MTQFDFDRIIDRRQSESIKWHYFNDDVLPMWVADMDLPAAPEIIAAMQERVAHGIFGYPGELPGLKEAILAWLEERYAWKVSAEQLVFLPGVVVGFNLMAQTVCAGGAGVLVQTPVYPPFLDVGAHASVPLLEAPLYPNETGDYQIDFDRFEQEAKKNTAMFLLCNPHNPVGRVFTRAELERMAEICLRHGVVICSDEIHSDLVFTGNYHLPIACLDAAIAGQTITLMSPSKTFNIPGLEFSFAVISNPELRKKVKRARRGLVGGVNLLGMVAARAAYRHGREWLDALLPYLEANRDWLARAVQESLPGIRMPLPQGTYLAWLDCRAANLGVDPCAFFSRAAKVGLNDGRTFGTGGEGHVRINFGCPRSLVVQGIEQMAAALEQRKG